MTPELRGAKGLAKWADASEAMSEIPASDALIEFVITCLDQGTSMIEDGSTLIPYVVSETPVGLELTRFVSDTLEQGREQAKAHAATSDADRVGVVYDGYLTVEGERSDAIFVEAQERGATPSVIFAQRYRPGGRFKKFNTIGNVAFVDEGDGVF
jgi:hypothetical protein